MEAVSLEPLDLTVGMVWYIGSGGSVGKALGYWSGVKHGP